MSPSPIRSNLEKSIRDGTCLPIAIRAGVSIHW